MAIVLRGLRRTAGASLPSSVAEVEDDAGKDDGKGDDSSRPLSVDLLRVSLDLTFLIALRGGGEDDEDDEDDDDEDEDVSSLMAATVDTVGGYGTTYIHHARSGCSSNSFILLSGRCQLPGSMKRVRIGHTASPLRMVTRNSTVDVLQNKSTCV